FWRSARFLPKVAGSVFCAGSSKRADVRNKKISEETQSGTRLRKAICTSGLTGVIILLVAAFPKVAFSAALRVSGSGNTGPFQTNTALKYENVFTNFGSSYNPSTGVFMAMVKGVYYFHFTAFSIISGGASTNVVLMKNGERSVSIASSAAVLQLEAGDNVHVQLMAGTLVYDDMGYYNSFSGFLLFPITP
uniref:C1q domain-containing protein n=1 Tax=Scleropages formosus TaxID=113540 RepID=A0A8C9SYU1_SCLFO